MNRQILIGLVALLAANSLLLAEQPAYRPGVVLVRFANEPNATAKSAILNSTLGRGGSSVKREFTLVKGLTQVSLPSGVSVESAVASLKQSSSILYAEPDYRLELLAIPNDTRFGELWGMGNIGQAGGTPGADISAPEAWDINTGSSSIIVAVTDTGVDYTHPDLAANMWVNPGEIPGNGIDDDHDGYIDDVYGCDTGDNDGNPMDDSAYPGHGTHVSGTIGAVGNNNRGVVGVCWHVRIMAIKLFDSSGGPYTWDAYVSNAVAGIQYSVAKGAKVINASWRAYEYSQNLYDAIASARDAGVIFVAAAGNENINNDSMPDYPASYDLDNIISVMATTNTDQRAFYSNYGLMSVDIGAPGGGGNGDEGDILSTYPGGQYVRMAGTSMASPHVAGACALLLSIDPTLTYSQVKQILLDTVDPILPGLCVSGGRLNLAAAAQEVTADTTPPMPTPAEWDIPPQATGLHTVTMKAQAATDRSGVEYYFECNDTNGIIKNSGWEPNALYSFTDLNSGTEYGFRFKARDKSANHNQTDRSTPTAFTKTASGTDTLPPFSDPARWEIKPKAGTHSIQMKARAAIDENPPMQYRFVEYPGTGIDSGWTSSNIFSFTPTDSSHVYDFQCQARDALLNETDLSTPGYARLDPNSHTIPVSVGSTRFPTIQSGIDAAGNGDIVVVSPGTYTGLGNYNINFNGKAITVRSKGPENPVIDCSFLGRGFIFRSGEGPDSILIGMTIINGVGLGGNGTPGHRGLAGSGGGIEIGTNESPYYSSHPTISDCIIRNCVAIGGNGGDGPDGADGIDYSYTPADPCAVPPTKDVVIDPTGGGYGNHGGDSGLALGGGIFVGPSSNPKIQNCMIDFCRVSPGNPGNGGDGGDGGDGNTTTANPPGWPGGNGGNGGNVTDVNGGGLYIAQDSGARVIGCTIQNCVAILPATSVGQPGIGGTGGGGFAPGANGQAGLPGQILGVASGGGAYYRAVGTVFATISATKFAGNYSQTNGGGMAFAPGAQGAAMLSGCEFSNNIAEANGGGIWYLRGASGATLTLSNCTINGNSASAGGGLSAGDIRYSNSDSNSAVVNIYDSSFASNDANGGGGVYLDKATLMVDHSTFTYNQSLEGGAINGFECNVNISDSNITDNAATVWGGGLILFNSDGNITNCDVKRNDANGFGGAAFLMGSSSPLNPLQFQNCLFTDNSAFFEGGALSCNLGAWAQLLNCTVVGNFAADSGGGVSCAESDAWVDIENSILRDNSAAQGPQIGVGTVSGSDPCTPIADVMVSYSDVQGGEDQVYLELDPSLTAVWWWSSNFDLDPLFANTDIREQTYYLSHFAAGQEANSPCINVGSANVSDPAINLSGYTTRTDGVADTCIVDVGYHYVAWQAKKYPLSIEVYEYDPNEGGHGRLNAKTTPQTDPRFRFDKNDPNTFLVYQGTIVNLTAEPNADYKVQYWRDTNNNASTAATNTVTMNSSKKVIVAFAPDVNYYLTVTVIGNGTVVPNGRTQHTPGEVVTLTATPTNPTDVIVWTGTDTDYSQARINTVTMTGHRNVTVEFYTTRILYVGGDSGYATIQTAIDDANDRDIIQLMPSDQPYYTQWGFVINGKDITITSVNPEDPAVVAATIIQQAVGENGNVSPAFLFYSVSPRMRLQGITIRGFSGSGGQSADGDSSRGYYDGLPGSTVYAMGIYCYSNASPTIVNCVIDDCHTYGGIGGKGAGGDTDHPNGGNGGWPGGANGSGLSCFGNSSPTIVNCTFSNNSAIGGNGGDGGDGSDNPAGAGGRGGGWYYGYDYPPPSPWEWIPPYSNSDLPKDYSGHGGAVYVGAGCTPTFVDCNFTNNSSGGGLNGICGQNPLGSIDEPSIRYKIDNLGGAVYLAADSCATFSGCTFANNVADTNKLPASNDAFVSFGGAVASEDDALPIFIDCQFSNNTSDVGGGLYSIRAWSEVNNCSFFDNTATHGGGILFSEGIAYVAGTVFNGNLGVASGSDGGAIGLLGINAEIIDCEITNNRVGNSGGGIYISSKNIDGNQIGGGNSVFVKNCLIAGNAGGLDGGGISANWYSDPNIVNCTIVNNKVSGLGGGLISSCGSYVNVLNSIIWGNEGGIGSSGSQIAVSSGGVSSTMQVRYSDVQDANDPCAWVVSDINALDLVFCIDTTGSMGGDINAVRTAARQITNAVAAQFADFRLALVDYRDYYDANDASAGYGAPGDWAYRDRVVFTTNANAIINGLQPMVANGGADWPESAYTALMHCINAGALEARLTANGLARLVAVDSPGVGNWREGKRVLRVILLMTDAPPHDPEPYTNYVLNDIVTAADGSNPIRIIPVQVRSDPQATSALRAIATQTGGTFVQAADSSAVVGAVLDVIGLFLQPVPPVYVDTDSAINWDPNTLVWKPNSHNINADPCFVFSGEYFLSQFAAGQPLGNQSPCVDAGSADVDSPGIELGGYTTRTDSVPDVGIVDMGYHYLLFTPPQYQLDINAVGPTIISPASNRTDWNWYSTVTLEVNPPSAGYQIEWTGTDNDDANSTKNTVLMDSDKTVTVAFVKNICDLTATVISGSGTVTPTSGTYSRGTVVTLTADPCEGYRVKQWTGTDNDASYALTNTVTMKGDKVVTVEFELPQMLTVPGKYTTIQSAIEAARQGDIVTVASGVYHGSPLYLDKEITLTSTNPDDPYVVAATIIDSSGYTSPVIVFYPTATQNTVVDGFTIRAGTWNPIDAPDTNGPGQNGYDGYSIGGGAVQIASGSSPTIKNCVIRDTNITGGNASDGGNADTTVPAGRGGWAGGSYGGGVFIDSYANPTFIHCTITNCVVRGGNAGNGGSSSGTINTPAYRDANHGGSWSNDFSFPWRQLIGSNGQPYVGDYRFYSGLGGGVFCSFYSSATFIACNITNNTAQGGMSGIGGTRPVTRPDPVFAYRIPSYGGGVFCGENSNIKFIDCNITGNTAPKPDSTYHIDPYLGYGGGIAFENTAYIKFKNCTISDNNAAVGGGMFWSGGEPQVLDSNILSNVAYVGGGAYAVESGGLIKGCTFRNNFAGVSPNDIDTNVIGQGGGIFGSSIETDIVDCLLTENVADASGGGIYVFGPVTGATTIKNCLLVGNEAGRDGGAISANWSAVVSVENCTLYNNVVTGTFGEPGSTGFGGGLYCSYGANTDVNNSIFWGDNGVFGPEIAIETGFEYDPLCGTVRVSYSDVEGGKNSVAVGSGCTLIWGDGGQNTDPLFVDAAADNFHLSQTAAGQSVDSPCVDAGGNRAIYLGFIQYSTATTGIGDLGTVDLGYHYPTLEPCRRADIVADNIVNFRDFAIFALSWLNEGCSDANGWCSSSDLGFDGSVGLEDLTVMADCWLEPLVLISDNVAPSPNPMTWAVEPYAASTTSVAMVATTATDDSGTVYYQFAETNGVTSGWRTDPCYVTTGLDPNVQHCYKARARDKYGNNTGWSTQICVTTTAVVDTNAPSPAPIMVMSDQNYLVPNIPDNNSASGQFQTNGYDWWHKVMVNVTDVTDDVSGTHLQIRFVCLTDDSFSSTSKISGPIYMDGAAQGDTGVGHARVTYIGTDYVVYDVDIDKFGGFGKKLDWKVCVYDAAMNEACSETHTLGPP